MSLSQHFMRQPGEILHHSISLSKFLRQWHFGWARPSTSTCLDSRNARFRSMWRLFLDLRCFQVDWLYRGRISPLCCPIGCSKARAAGTTWCHFWSRCHPQEWPPHSTADSSTSLRVTQETNYWSLRWRSLEFREPLHAVQISQSSTWNQQQVHSRLPWGHLGSISHQIPRSQRVTRGAASSSMAPWKSNLCKTYCCRSLLPSTRPVWEQASALAISFGSLFLIYLWL